MLQTARMLDSPMAALAALFAEVDVLDAERIGLDAAAGRVLAESIRSDRPSPSCDVSAMDGFAIRASDSPGRFPVVDAVRIGREPPVLPAGAAIRIVTGGPIPEGADAVVRHEEAGEADGTITLGAIEPGRDIRFRGENTPEGELIAAAGSLLDAARMAALATFRGTGEIGTVLVHRRARVAVLVTGDELVDSQGSADPWQVRDSNGPALLGALRRPWLDVTRLPRVADEPEPLREAIVAALAGYDALVLTGGVSMGERDHVPDCVRAAGAKVLFHKVRQRPGKPILGAVANGKPILALPGNPVSVLVTARRLVLPTLAHRCGVRDWPAEPRVRLESTFSSKLQLWLHRLAKLRPDGTVELIRNQGSSDLVAAARSDGFVEIPPEASGGGPYAFFAW